MVFSVQGAIHVQSMQNPTSHPSSLTECAGKRLGLRFCHLRELPELAPTSRAVVHGDVRHMHALSLGVLFGKWLNAARCRTSEEASLSAQAVCLCCPVQSPTSLSKPMLTRIGCPSWFLLWSVEQARCERLFGHSADMVQKEGSDQCF